jgi:hypothetical protein
MNKNTTAYRRKIAGLCIGCGRQAPENSKVRCTNCLKISADYVLKKINNLRSQGLCKCGTKPEQGKMCTRCKAKYRLINPIKYRKLRDLVFSKYGGYRCSCCGETEVMFLEIDHINGGGNKHRKETNYSVYQWIKNNNFPFGFQVLCHNCNKGKYRNGGVCPHKEKIYVG